MSDRNLPKSLQKYQSNESVSSAISGCGWLEFKHELYYPDDKGQTVPAAGAHYRVIGANGSRHEGKLDANGSVSLKGVGHGSVVIEVEPDIELEIKQLQDEVKKELDKLVEAEREETRKIKEEYEKSGWWGRRGKDLKAVGSGLWNFVKNIFGALWSILEGIGSALTAITIEASEYILDPYNAPETFKEDVKAVQQKYDALKEFATEDLETYFLFMKDENTGAIFKNFAGDYLEAQHYSEYIEGGTEAVLGVILTIITAGAGGAAAAGAAGGRLAKAAKSLSKPIKKLADLIKSKKTKTLKKDKSNKKVFTTITFRVACFAPGATLIEGFKKRHPEGVTPEGRTLSEEFNRQLLNQEKGINKMSPDDLIDGIDRYSGVRSASKAKKIREAYKRSLTIKRKEELLKKGIAISEAQKQAKDYADNATKQMAVLHNPDGYAGGKDQFDVKKLDKHIGDKGVNSSLGSQWNKEDRVASLRKEAVETKKLGHKKMNTKLKRCK